MSDAAAAKTEWRSGRLSIWGNLTRVIDRRETIRFMVISNLKAGHRDKVLGNVWSLLDPLFLIATFFVVFGVGLRQAGSNPWEYVLYISIGIVGFGLLDGIVSQAAVSIRSHAGILHHISFPKAIIPIALCFSRLYDFLWSFAVIAGAAYFAGIPFTVHLVWLPLIIALQFFLGMGLAFIVAYLGAFYADTRNITAAVMRLFFFGSPLFYFVRTEFGHEGIIPEQYIRYYMLNPIAGILEGYRDVILWGRAPDLTQLAYVAGVALVVLIIGFALFSRGEGDYAKYV